MGSVGKYVLELDLYFSLQSPSCYCTHIEYKVYRGNSIQNGKGSFKKQKQRNIYSYLYTNKHVSIHPRYNSVHQPGAALSPKKNPGWEPACISINIKEV